MDIGQVLNLTANIIYKYCLKFILDYLYKNHFYGTLGIVFAAAAVYYSGAGFFPEGEFRWYTCCLLMVIVLGVFIVTKCIKGIKAKWASKAETRRKARPSPGQTRTEGDNEGNRWDILVIHDDSEETNCMVCKYRDHLEKDLEVENLRVELVGNIGIGQGHFTVMENVFDRYLYIFIFLTPNFTEDILNRFKMQMGLMQSLQDPNKQGRFVPVWTTNKKELTKNYPRELEPLIPVHYWRFDDDNYKKDYLKYMQKLIDSGRKSFL